MAPTPPPPGRNNTSQPRQAPSTPAGVRRTAHDSPEDYLAYRRPTRTSHLDFINIRERWHPDDDRELWRDIQVLGRPYKDIIRKFGRTNQSCRLRMYYLRKQHQGTLRSRQIVRARASASNRDEADNLLTATGEASTTPAHANEDNVDDAAEALVSLRQPALRYEEFTYPRPYVGNHDFSSNVSAQQSSTDVSSTSPEAQQPPSHQRTQTTMAIRSLLN